MANTQQVKKAIAVMLAAYPRANGNDQDSMRQFLLLVENFLAQYPNEVLEAMVAPRTGIMAVCPHLPSIAEMKKFCDRKWDILSPKAVAENQEEVRALYGPKVAPEMDADHRARMLEKMQHLIKEIGGMGPATLVNKEEFIRLTNETLERWAEQAQTNAPPKLSEEALAKLNLPRNG